MSVSNTLSATLSVSVAGSGKAIKTPVGSYTAAQGVQEAVVITAGASNTHIVVAFPYATLQLLIMAADQDITVKVNSSSTPTETFALKSTAGVYWGHDMAIPNPLAHDVTDLYISNAGATDAKFDLWALHN